MPGENIQDWSTTAANNSNADTSINWTEGQARASVNDSARSMMAAHAKDRNLKNGSITTAGTANAQTFTSGLSYITVPTSLTVMLKIGPGLTNTAAATLSMDGTAAVAIKDQAGGALLGGELVAGSYVQFRYDGTNWVLLQGTPATVAPLDALAYSGMQINGSFEVDQPNAGAAVAVAAGTVAHANLMDGWYCAKTGTSAVSIQQTASVFPGYTKELKLTVTTAQASIGSDTVDIRQAIEGYRISRLAWGSASAVPMTVGFWVKSSIAGTLNLLASNSTLAVNATASVTITSASVAQFVTATFAAQTTGTWLVDGSAGIIVSIRVAGSGSINIAAIGASTFELTGFFVLPGSGAPSAARSALIMRPYDQELPTCQRYYRWLPFNMQYNAAAPSSEMSAPMLFATMRATPTVSVIAADPNLSQVATNNGANLFDLLTPYSARVYLQSTSAGVCRVYGYRSSADARL